MNMCDITFEVPRSSTFVFKKSSENKMFTIIFVVRSLKGFGLNNVVPASQTVAQDYLTIGPMYRVIRVVAFRALSVTHMAVRANTGQSLYPVSMLGQRRIRLTCIEPAMGCDAGPTLNQYWVGRPRLCVPGTSS